MEKGKGVAEWGRKGREGRKGDLMRWGGDRRRVGLGEILSGLCSTSYSPAGSSVPLMALGLDLCQALAMGMLRNRRASCHAHSTPWGLLCLHSSCCSYFSSPFFIPSLHITCSPPFPLMNTDFPSFGMNKFIACREENRFCLVLGKYINRHYWHLSIWSSFIAVAATLLWPQLIGT